MPFIEKKPINNERLVYTLLRNGRHIAFTIHYMDERFRSKGPINSFEASNGIIILSGRITSINYSPDMRTRIYLLGRKEEHDSYIATASLPSEKEAKNVCKKIQEALAEWSDSWKGFVKKDKIKSDFDCKTITI